MLDLFEERFYEKALSRANDELRLSFGEISRENLQKENSVVDGFQMQESRVLDWG